MTDQEQTERGASTFGCNHTSDDDSCPARVLYERVYQKDLPDLFGWFRFHHGWHARDADLERVTAERDNWRSAAQEEIEKRHTRLEPEIQQLRAERDAMREVCDLAPDALVILAGLHLGTTWELSPYVKDELARVTPLVRDALARLNAWDIKDSDRGLL